MLVDTTTTDAAFDAAYDDASDAGAKLGGEGRGSSGALDVSEHTGANPASMNSGESSPVHSHANSSNTVGTTPAAPTGSTAVSGPTATTAATPQVPLQALEGTKMSLLLRPPAIPLNIESTCMALNERIVAAESCCFISMVSSLSVYYFYALLSNIHTVLTQILLELKSKLMKLVPAEHVAAVEQFVTQYQRVAGQLRALIYRALCPQLIKFNSVRYNSICALLCEYYMLYANNMRFLCRFWCRSRTARGTARKCAARCTTGCRVWPITAAQYVQYVSLAFMLICFKLIIHVVVLLLLL